MTNYKCSSSRTVQSPGCFSLLSCLGIKCLGLFQGTTERHKDNVEEFRSSELNLVYTSLFNVINTIYLFILSYFILFYFVLAMGTEHKEFFATFIHTVGQ